MYDYVIVGGGSSGCALAARLSEDGQARVLLLEAGGPDTGPDDPPAGRLLPDDHRPLTWGYATAPLRQADGREMVFPQGRVLGGGSSINAMVYTRGNARDYDAWAEEEGCAGWSYREVLPYFRRAEDNERLVERLPRHGRPVGRLRPDQPAPAQRAPGSGRRRRPASPTTPTSTARARRARPLPGDAAGGAALLGRGRLPAAGLEAPQPHRADRLPGDPDRGRARPGGRRRLSSATAREEMARAEAEVLVASGAVGSPKLLLLSGIGPADELAAVGIAAGPRPAGRRPEPAGPHRRLLDPRAQRRRNLRQAHPAAPHALGRAAVRAVPQRPGDLATSPRPGGSGRPTRTWRSPDIQFHFLPGAGLEAGVPPLDGYGCTLNSCHLRPRSRGTVRLQERRSLRPRR